ncbi:MAG: DNA polymerase II [gamma proteobacterium endosymbiont of Lamellibrachia anaximandri]|nr:DNA polymerase II [gamma proteobacterium endosymbiont of Lamellibrachia anaximandri]MBL3533935.1 DNA polymerase II [gamma proteobacterium endosymbiont of Lamellibrachia anaximandri]
MPAATGFLLTRHWRDRPNGIDLVFWVHTQEGPLRCVYPDQRAVCFISSEIQLGPGYLPGSRLERKPLDLQGLDGGAVDGLYFSAQKSLQQFRQRAAADAIPLYESDIKPHDRYLMERFITASLEVLGHPVQKAGYRELVNPRLRPATITPELSYVSLDIETNAFSSEILSIALSCQGREVILMQGDGADWTTDLPVEWFPGERELLIGYFARVREWDPDLILGWNVISFDLNTIELRCRHHRLRFDMGRGDEQAAILQPQQTGQVRIASIPGRVVLDGIDNLKAAFWRFDSFALGFVAHKLLGRKKLIEGSEGKVEEILRLFREDKPALAAYNLEDCRLVEAIFEKTDLLNFVIQRSVMTGLPLGRQGGSVAAFDNLYLPRLHRAGVVAPDVGANTSGVSSPGGYVMDSQPGLYENVLVLDFKSLYPSIIRTFLIDPLGLVRPGDDPVPGFLGAVFSRKASILPEIITELWQQRDEAKQQGDRSLSQAIKIIMNSFYGVLGSSGCRFHDARLASSITRRGHEIITSSRDYIEQQGYRVIYGDTDSVFVLLGSDHDEAVSNRIGRQLKTSLNQWWSDKLQTEYRLESALEIEFETHFIRFVMPTLRGAETGSKKRYAGYVRNGAGEYELVFKGLESVRSDWTPLAQVFQRELYRRVFFTEPWEDYIRETVASLKSGALDEQLVYRKRIRNPLESYQRNVPPHIQAARKLERAGRWISYLITLNGPEPLADLRSTIDYQHYIDRQLAPVADGILHFVGGSFERITTNQMDLF